MRWALAAICAALALGGCGGGGDSESGSAASGTTNTTEATATALEPSRQSAGQKQGKAKPAGSVAKDGGKNSTSSPQSESTVKVPPISSAPVAGSKPPAPGVATVKGGDNSVQTYGVEADSSERTQAAIALQAYLNARAEEDWEGVCSALAQRATAQLIKLSQSASGQGKDIGCAGVMAILDKGTPASQRREEATIAEVLSFRGGGDVPGNPSYLIFEGPPGKTLYSMPMYLEAGGWKVGLAQPSELPV